jgi:hypothetical protein
MLPGAAEWRVEQEHQDEMQLIAVHLHVQPPDIM